MDTDAEIEHIDGEVVGDKLSEGEQRMLKRLNCVRRLGEPVRGLRGWAALVLWLVLVSGSASAGTSAYFSRVDGPVVKDLVVKPDAPQRGVILIVVDTIRPDLFGVYGNSRPTTPFIDSLASEGVVFLNHFSNSTWTKPSVASILTGQLPRRHNVLPVTSKLSRSTSTLAQAFKDAGYATGAVIANKFAGKTYGFNRGYDRYIDATDPMFPGGFPTAEEVLRIARRWIAMDRERPFFYTILLVDPHDPYKPPPYYRNLMCPTCQSPEVHTPLREYNGRGPSQKQIDDMKSLYMGEIRYADDQLRLFFDGLKKLGLDKDLTVVVVGDHGEAFGEHAVFEHAFHCWDEVIRTPLIIRSPRLEARGFYTGLSQHADVFPTIARLAGIPTPDGVQGHPVVRTPSELPISHDRVVVSEVQMYGIHRTVIRNSRYKLIRHEPLDEVEFRQYYSDPRIYPSVVLGQYKVELYDMLADPYERTDIYARERGQVLALERKLEHYLQTGEVNEEDEPVAAPSEEVIQDLKSLGYFR